VLYQPSVVAEIKASEIKLALLRSASEEGDQEKNGSAENAIRRGQPVAESMESGRGLCWWDVCMR